MKRFDLSWSGVEGEWVKAEDVKKLEELNREMKEAIQKHCTQCLLETADTVCEVEECIYYKVLDKAKEV